MKDYINFLKSYSNPNGLINKLKCYCRPLIVPVDYMISLINSDDKVFDIGCGNGQFCALYVKFGKVKQIRGTEIKIELVQNANMLFQKMPQENLDFEFSLFDGINFPDYFKSSNKIILNDVLHHVPKITQVKFLKNIFNEMESGTQLIIKDIDAASIFVYFNKLHDLAFSQEIGQEMKLKNLVDIMKEIGFTMKSIYKKQILVYPHYIVVFEKP